jgi:hypothetical protein
MRRYQTSEFGALSSESVYMASIAPQQATAALELIRARDPAIWGTVPGQNPSWYRSYSEEDIRALDPQASSIEQTAIRR